MALGLILRVSWICFLLFDGSAGLPFKGYGYRVKNDLRNLGDDGEDEALLSSLSAQSNWQAYGGQDVAATLTGPGSPNQNLNSGSSGSGYYNPHLVYEDVFQYPEPSNAAGQYGQADYMSEGSSTSSTQQGSFPSYPTYVGAQPAYPSVVLSPSYGFSGGENPNFSQLGYQPRDEIPSLPQTYVSPQNVQVAQRVSEPILPPPPPSYIVQSRNGYQRARYLFNKSRYSPEVGLPLSVHSKGAKGNPAAPKGAKNPERTSVHG
ncbi:uncharacterized protein LOC129098002 [Anoplopoma fimbria]|uniref:uncharacterized protein LOC129098002 n=1 Tax=Anoplopoma fimbria TaxID=229290 RepID=UPI0023EBCC50|nr:uncharacterized protein LOC129098002 [Anoplopoma fimbria]